MKDFDTGDLSPQDIADLYREAPDLFQTWRRRRDPRPYLQQSRRGVASYPPISTSLGRDRLDAITATTIDGLIDNARTRHAVLWDNPQVGDIVLGRDLVDQAETLAHRSPELLPAAAPIAPINPDANSRAVIDLAIQKIDETMALLERLRKGSDGS